MSSQTFTCGIPWLLACLIRPMLAYCCDSQPAEAVRLALIPDLRLMTCRIWAGQSLGVESGGADSCLRGGHWAESRYEISSHCCGRDWDSAVDIQGERAL
jgi:hypothetical protein